MQKYCAIDCTQNSLFTMINSMINSFVAHCVAHKVKLRASCANFVQKQDYQQEYIWHQPHLHHLLCAIVCTNSYPLINHAFLSHFSSLLFLLSLFSHSVTALSLDSSSIRAFSIIIYPYSNNANSINLVEYHRLCFLQPSI